MRNAALALGFVVAIASASPDVARAGLVYDNGPVNGATGGAWNITPPFSVSNSFVVTSNTTLTSATVALWVGTGISPDGTNWSIGTSAFASDVSSGVSFFSNTLVAVGFFPDYDLYSSSFAISSVLTAGTYWFSLANTTTSDGISPAYWDENQGTSTAFLSPGMSSIPSESFQLYGTSAVVPEPATLALLGIGMVSALPMLRKRKPADG